MRVRVPFVQTSAASVPKVVRDRLAEDQTARGIVAPRDVDAVKTVALVLLLIVVIAEAMVLLTAVVTAAMLVESEVEALVTSDCTARDPDERPAPVSVRVPLAQTSAARVPNVVKDLVALDQTARGIVAPRDVEAVRTVALVLELIVVIADAMVALTPVVTAAILVERDVEAARTVALVLALTALVPLIIFVASEVEALSTVELVLELIDEIADATWLLVLVLTTPAIDDEAVPTILLVFAFTAAVLAVMFAANEVEAFSTTLFVLALTAVVTAAMFVEREVEAFVTSDCTAREPDESVALVIFRVE